MACISLRTSTSPLTACNCCLPRRDFAVGGDVLDDVVRVVVLEGLELASVDLLVPAALGDGRRSQRADGFQHGVEDPFLRGGRRGSHEDHLRAVLEEALVDKVERTLAELETALGDDRAESLVLLRHHLIDPLQPSPREQFAVEGFLDAAAWIAAACAATDAPSAFHAAGRIEPDIAAWPTSSGMCAVGSRSSGVGYP